MASRRRGPAPLPGASASIRIESCPLEGKVSVRFLGRYFGTYCHFVSKKQPPKPCMGDECPAQLHKGRKIWKGYAPAMWWRGGEYQEWVPCVWEVTESLDQKLDGLELRGSEWEIERKPGDTGKPEVQGVYLCEFPTEELIAAWDVFPQVSRLYGYLPMQWDVKSHIPKRLYLAPVKGTPPQGTAKLDTVNSRVLPLHTPISDEDREKIQEARRGIFPGDPRSHFDLMGKRITNGKAVLS